MNLPSSITTSITVYPVWIDKETGVEHAIRCVLDNCYWNSKSTVVQGRTSTDIVQVTSIRIPVLAVIANRSYVEYDTWKDLAFDQLEYHWTVDKKRMPLVVQGILEHEFVPALPTAANRIAVQEAALVQEVQDILRVQEIKDNRKGSTRMHHMRLRC